MGGLLNTAVRLSRIFKSAGLHVKTPSSLGKVRKASDGPGHKTVQNPGIKGGKWYMTPTGEIRYGTPPTGEANHTPLDALEAKHFKAGQKVTYQVKEGLVTGTILKPQQSGLHVDNGKYPVHVAYNLVRHTEHPAPTEPQQKFTDKHMAHGAIVQFTHRDGALKHGKVKGWGAHGASVIGKDGAEFKVPYTSITSLDKTTGATPPPVASADAPKTAFGPHNVAAGDKVKVQINDALYTVNVSKADSDGLYGPYFDADGNKHGNGQFFWDEVKGPAPKFDKGSLAPGDTVMTADGKKHAVSSLHAGGLLSDKGDGVHYHEITGVEKGVQPAAAQNVELPSDDPDSPNFIGYSKLAIKAGDHWSASIDGHQYDDVAITAVHPNGVYEGTFTLGGVQHSGVFTASELGEKLNTKSTAASVGTVGPASSAGQPPSNVAAHAASLKPESVAVGQQVSVAIDGHEYPPVKVTALHGNHFEGEFEMGGVKQSGVFTFDEVKGPVTVPAPTVHTLPPAKPSIKTKPAKKATAPKFDASKLTAPPDFQNWGGSGKPGPSGTQEVNDANHASTQAIYAAAKTGDIEKIKALTAPVIDKQTKQITGHVPVLQHPSQHVKGYAEQAMSEIEYQKNPPPKFEFREGSKLWQLDKAVSPIKNWFGAAVKKLGKFLHLGDADADSGELSALPHLTHQSGKLGVSTYAGAAKKSWSKLTETQRQAVKSYTGGGYHNINHSLWSGNASGAAASVGSAIHTHGHEIQAGTVLSRRITLDGAALTSIKGSVGKILQEPAVMSTSIDPGVWSGNVHFKLKCGPGVKGLYVGPGTGISSHNSEKELLLPPNTRLWVQKVNPAGAHDPDGFNHGMPVIEAIVLPSKQ